MLFSKLVELRFQIRWVVHQIKWTYPIKFPDSRIIDCELNGISWTANYVTVVRSQSLFQVLSTYSWANGSNEFTRGDIFRSGAEAIGKCKRSPGITFMFCIYGEFWASFKGYHSFYDEIIVSIFFFFKLSISQFSVYFMWPVFLWVWFLLCCYSCYYYYSP